MTLKPHQRFGINQVLNSGWHKKVTDRLAEYPKVGLISLAAGNMHSHYALVREMNVADHRPVIVVVPKTLHDVYKRDIEGADKNVYISTQAFQRAKERPLIDDALLDFRYLQSRSQTFVKMRDAIIEANTATVLFNANRNLNTLLLCREIKLPVFALYSDPETTLKRIEVTRHDY